MMYWPMRLTATPARQSNSPSPLPYSPNSLTKIPFESKTCTRWFDESATTMLLSGPTARPRGHVKDPGSLPRPPNWNSCCRLRRYTCLGIVPPVIPAAAAATVGDVGEPSPFFDPSSSDEANSFACRNGRPRLRRRDTSLAVLRPVAEPAPAAPCACDVVAVEAWLSRAPPALLLLPAPGVSLEFLLPYLLFR